MDGAKEPNNLEQMLECFKQAEKDDITGKVSMRHIMQEIGQRSFGPLLLFSGIITLLPIIGDIPGVPTLMGVMVVLVSVQLLCRAKYFWLPDWLLNQSVSKEKLDKAIRWGEKPAKFIDRFLRPRLSFLTRGPGVMAIAIACIIIAIAMPPMEFVPFTANGAGLALTLFGLSLISQDGLLAVVAYLLTSGTLLFVTLSFV